MTARDAGAIRKTVIDYVDEAEPGAVVAAYNEAYGWSSEDPNTIERATYDRFRTRLRGENGVSVPTNMRVILSYAEPQISQHPRDGLDGNCVDVRGVDDEGNFWALGLTPWAEWKLMVVEDRTGKNLATAEIAAHLFSEMA